MKEGVCGLLDLPNYGLFGELPECFEGYEIVKMPVDEVKDWGACNAFVLDTEKVLMTDGCPKITKELEKRNFEVIEVPFKNQFELTGSGIHCSILHLWREFD